MMNQIIYNEGDKVLYLKYYECEVIDIMSDVSKVTLLYLIQTLESGRRFIAYPEDLTMID